MKKQIVNAFSWSCYVAQVCRRPRTARSNSSLWVLHSTIVGQWNCVLSYSLQPVAAYKTFQIPTIKHFMNFIKQFLVCSCARVEAYLLANFSKWSSRKLMCIPGIVCLGQSFTPAKGKQWRTTYESKEFASEQYINGGEPLRSPYCASEVKCTPRSVSKLVSVHGNTFMSFIKLWNIWPVENPINYASKY